jgi:hypothetical protein
MANSFWNNTHVAEEDSDVIRRIASSLGRKDLQQSILFCLWNIEAIHPKVPFIKDLENRKKEIRSGNLSSSDLLFNYSQPMFSRKRQAILKATLNNFMTYLAGASIAAEENRTKEAWQIYSAAEHQLGYYLGLTSTSKTDSEKSKRAAETRTYKKDIKLKLLLGYLIELKVKNKKEWRSKQAAAEAVAKKFISDNPEHAKQKKTDEENLNDLTAEILNLIFEKKEFERAYEA